MIKLTAIQKKHGYVEACVDFILTEKWDDLDVRPDDIRTWDVDKSTLIYSMSNPAPLAVRVADELAMLARRAARPSLAVPAERVAGDIYYTIVEKENAVGGKYTCRKLRSEASREAVRHINAACN